MVINMHDTTSQYETYQAWLVYFIVVVVVILLIECHLKAKSPLPKKVSVSFQRLNLSWYFQDKIMFLKS